MSGTAAEGSKGRRELLQAGGEASKDFRERVHPVGEAVSHSNLCFRMGERHTFD